MNSTKASQQLKPTGLGATNKSQQKSSNLGRSRNRGQRASEFVTKQELRGGKIHVPINPPEIAYQPWMPLTLVHTGSSSDVHLTVRDICKQIKEQIDPMDHALKSFGKDWADTECIMQIRLRSIRAWNLTGRMISLSVDDFSDIAKATGDVDTLCGLVDTGSSLHIPAIGYRLPASHSNMVLRNDKATNGAILFHVMAPRNDTYIIYTSLFFRFDGPAKLSGFDNTMVTLLKQIANSTARTARVGTDIAKNVKDLADRSDHSTMMNTISKGVEVVGPAVFALPALTDEEDKFRIEMRDKIDHLISVTTSVKDDVSVISASEVVEDV